MAFRVKFYEGWPAAEYEWVVSRDFAYTAEFSTVVAVVQARMSAKTAAVGRDHPATYSHGCF